MHHLAPYSQHVPRWRRGQKRWRALQSAHPTCLLPDVARLATFITERKQAEAALRTAHGELEERVQARTAELAQANRELQIEIAERTHAERPN